MMRMISWLLRMMRMMDDEDYEDAQDDEDFLVDNEEEMDVKEELEIKQDSTKEYLGKLQYKVRNILFDILSLLVKETKLTFDKYTKYT